MVFGSIYIADSTSTTALDTSFDLNGSNISNSRNDFYPELSGQWTKYEQLNNFLKSNVAINIIRKYTGEATLSRVIEEFAANDLQSESGSEMLLELAQLLDYLGQNYGYYGGPYLDYVLDEDTNDLLFFRLIFERANRKEWKEIESDLISKQVLTKGLLAVFCLQGFQG